jgi:acetoin utilization deacetylase AcuC-like enzyme
MSLIIISSERFAEHQTPPGHPESASRADVMDVVAGEWRECGGEVLEPHPATRDQLARVHDTAYIDLLQGSLGESLAFDVDTYTSPESAEIARLSAGAAISAVEHVLSGPHRRALAMVRPPGHHAERNRAMGFCLYNNIAVAAAHARALGTARVAIVDYDVHHGNGTQHAFEADPSILYISTHQYPFYPGTGAPDERGTGSAKGFTINLPLEAGAVDEDYRVLFAEVIVPVLLQFKPDLLLVSAGFDAHEQDPLGGMRLAAPAFAAMTAELVGVADACSGGRIVLVTEGGYHLRALAESLRGVVGVLASDTVPHPGWTAPAADHRRARDTISRATHLLAPFWKL